MAAGHFMKPFTTERTISDSVAVIYERNKFVYVEWEKFVPRASRASNEASG